jgi:protein-L-isoaspartate(D-aspartate) O-methyltransferase
MLSGVAIERITRAGPTGMISAGAMDFAAARRNMVDGQLRPRTVNHQGVLAALEAVPREMFVPEIFRSVAYVDGDIPLGNGRFLMEPVTLARLLQAASVKPTDVALDIGCATGYSAAVLARLAKTVIALESDGEMASRASANIGELGIDNAVVVEGALDRGVPAEAPYDVILIDGGVESIPSAVLEQLGEGGRLATVVLGRGIGRATLTVRSAGNPVSRPLFDAAASCLPGFGTPHKFLF